mgnify:CR=1 FL=1
MGRMWQWGLVWLWAGWAQARLPGWAPCWSSLLEPLGLGSPEETALPSRLCPSDPPAPLGSPEVSPCPLLPCTGLRWVWVWAGGGRGWPDHRARCTASGPGAGWLQGRVLFQCDCLAATFQLHPLHSLVYGHFSFKSQWHTLMSPEDIKIKNMFLVAILLCGFSG